MARHTLTMTWMHRIFIAWRLHLPNHHWLNQRNAMGRRSGLAALGFLALIVASFASTCPRSWADALVLTRAMQASTIAEIFVERERIRVELEVGAPDLPAFANCLPDKSYEAITGDVEPLETRLATFFDSDWVMRGDDRPLKGKLKSMFPAKRVARDEVTGEALSEQPEDVETVVRITLEFRFEETGKPAVLSLRPPLVNGAAAASIGFVCYHKGLPVNDFRYLSSEVTLDLDWDDPWYSRFRHPNLRRQFDAPIATYLYVEPYEVRKEIIVRPIDLQDFVDLDLTNDGVIRVQQQGELKQRIANFLADRNPVTIDGQVVEGKLDRIHFVQRSLKTTGIIEPPVDLDTVSATLGVIFVYPIDRLPQKVSMVCDLFTPKVQSIPAVASDEAGGLPSVVTPEDPVLVWKNYLINPRNSELTEVARPPSPRSFIVPLASVLCGGLAAVFGVLLGQRIRSQQPVSRWAGIVPIALLLLAGMLFPVAKISVANPFASPQKVSDQDARDILSGLLHNVYRSFDHHDEGLIYDRLAKSISGDLLEEIYLETRQSMEVKNQGGLRISVKEVAVTKLEPIDGKEPEHAYRCRWRVSGWIGHWGHVHSRENEHLALITIAVQDGRWKIKAMEMLDQSPMESTMSATAMARGGNS